MSRRNRESRISFFSFQDIIMSVVGIVILITLLLILKLIAQMALAEPVPTPEFTEAELNERIESLEQSRREIQDEIALANQARREAAPNIPTLDQIDALRSSTARLDADIEKIEEDLEAAKTRRDELRNRPDAKIAEEKEANIGELQRKKEETQQQNQGLAAREREDREKLDDLKNQRAGLDRKLAEDIAKKVYVTPHKSTDKIPFILIYGSNPVNDKGTITVLSLTDSSRQSFTSEKEFFRWAADRNKATEYFVLYVRPSRFEKYERILNELRKMGFDTGLQVIGEKTEITFQ